MDLILPEEEVSIDQLIVPQEILHEVNNQNKIFLASADQFTATDYTSSKHVCNKCGSQFLEKRHLLLHNIQHTSERPIVCQFCNQRFKHRAHLSMHMNRHNPSSCSQCGLQFPDSDTLESHKKIHKPRLMCSICQKTLACKKSLETHELWHAGKMRFSCEVCFKSFMYKHSLVSHMCVVSVPKEKRFSCDVCSKMYRYVSELKRHKRHHEEARDWNCNHCGKAYPLQSTLKTHLKIHAVRKPFACATCNCGFMKKALLKKHISCIHLLQSSTVLCHLCPKMFYDLTDLKQHMLTHTKQDKV